MRRKQVKEFRTTKYFLRSLKHKFGKLKHAKNKKLITSADINHE